MKFALLTRGGFHNGIYYDGELGKMRDAIEEREEWEKLREKNRQDKVRKYKKIMKADQIILEDQVQKISQQIREHQIEEGDKEMKEEFNKFKLEKDAKANAQIEKL